MTNDRAADILGEVYTCIEDDDELKEAISRAMFVLDIVTDEEVAQCKRDLLELANAQHTDIVKAQPAANVEPIVEAYWIRDYAIENNMADPGEVIARCTNCGWFALHDSYNRLLDYYNRCPHCGAHMKSAKEIIGDKEFEWYCK